MIAFDELNDPDAPGETLALMETIGLNNVELKNILTLQECPILNSNHYFKIIDGIVFLFL